MKYMIIFTVGISIVWTSLSFSQAEEWRLPASFTDKRFTMNFRNAEIKYVFELISKQTGINFIVDKDVSESISYSFTNVTLQSALDQITLDYQLKYLIENNQIYIYKQKSSSGGLLTSLQDTRLIKLNYMLAKEIPQKLKTLLEPGESVIIDEPTNSIAVYGSPQTISKIKAFVKMFDKMPPQILIEALIIEINKNKSLEWGFSYGDETFTDKTVVDGGSGFLKTALPAAPNLNWGVKIGKMDGNTLQARIAAAESNGDAKIISRPKIITINNQTATITSGIKFNIKTLSSTSTGSGADSTSITGGLQTVTAGLDLKVTPTIVANSKIKLIIEVTNSEPDESQSVDGIPGVVDNSAKTTIIVESGKTATMAGLIKNSFGKSSSGIPYLSKIPILGWLFRSESHSDRQKELMIFITPKILKENVAKSTHIDTNSN